MAADGRQVGHAQTAAVLLVDDRHPLELLRIFGITPAHLVEKALVDLVDDLQVPRQDALEERDRPGFERFGHQRVVGIRTGLARDVPGAIPVEPVDVEQHAHQLRDGERGMRIVQLDGHLVRQLVQVRMAVEEAAQDVLQRRADEEVLLLQA